MDEERQHEPQDVRYLLQRFNILYRPRSCNLWENIIQYQSKLRIIEHIYNLRLFINLNLLWFIYHLPDFILEHIHVFFQCFIWLLRFFIIWWLFLLFWSRKVIVLNGINLYAILPLHIDCFLYLFILFIGQVLLKHFFLDYRILCFVLCDEHVDVFMCID